MYKNRIILNNIEALCKDSSRYLYVLFQQQQKNLYVYNFDVMLFFLTTRTVI